jgi:hypothetical protein
MAKGTKDIRIIIPVNFPPAALPNQSLVPSHFFVDFHTSYLFPLEVEEENKTCARTSAFKISTNFLN